MATSLSLFRLGESDGIEIGSAGLVAAQNGWEPVAMASPTDLRPPFTAETAARKVQAAQDAWNSRDPERVALAYTEDSEWRNRDEFLSGRAEIRAFLERKWAAEQEYVLEKQLWAFTEDRIGVRFEYESRDAAGQWWRSYGNEMWEFAPDGLMARRYASINDAPIGEGERRLAR